MKRVLMTSIALAVSGCASPGGGAIAPTPNASVGAVAKRAEPSEEPVALLRRAGGPDAPTAARVRALLGTPDIVRDDGRGSLWTWRLPTCALVLGFSDNRLLVVEATTLRQGEPAPDLSICVREARARIGRPA